MPRSCHIPNGFSKYGYYQPARHRTTSTSGKGLFGMLFNNFTFYHVSRVGPLGRAGYFWKGFLYDIFHFFNFFFKLINEHWSHNWFIVSVFFCRDCETGTPVCKADCLRWPGVSRVSSNPASWRQIVVSGPDCLVVWEVEKFRDQCILTSRCLSCYLIMPMVERQTYYEICRYPGNELKRHL